MPKSLTLKIINDSDVLDELSGTKPITEAQKELIAFIAREAVREYIRQIPMNSPQEAQDRILRLPEVIKATGLSRSSIYMFISSGTFPKQIVLGVKSVGWKESKIKAWLNTRSLR